MNDSGGPKERVDRRYARRGVLWELWCEPNGVFCEETRECAAAFGRSWLDLRAFMPQLRAF